MSEGFLCDFVFCELPPKIQSSEESLMREIRGVFLAARLDPSQNVFWNQYFSDDFGQVFEK